MTYGIVQNGQLILGVSKPYVTDSGMVVYRNGTDVTGQTAVGEFVWSLPPLFEASSKIAFSGELDIPLLTLNLVLQSFSGFSAQASILVSPSAHVATLFDWHATVISQYANSPIILQLLDNFFQYIDQQANLDAFYQLMWNVDTASGYGLDVWGRIVGVGRVLQLSNLGKTFGFDEMGPVYIDPFNVSPFYSGATSTSNFALSDAAYRTLIFAKALANISNGGIQAINQLLINLFGSASGNVYVVDGGDMTMAYAFSYIPTPLQVAIVTQTGILPKPVGVAMSISITTPPSSGSVLGQTFGRPQTPEYRKGWIYFK